LLRPKDAFEPEIRCFTGELILCWQDLLQVFGIFLSMLLSTDDHFFLKRIRVLYFNIKSYNNWFKQIAAGESIIYILNYPVYCATMKTEIQSHEGLKAGSSPAQKAFVAFLFSN
jgi:hypothetical protein